MNNDTGDRAFRSELNQHLAKEVAQELRAEAVKELARYMVQKDEEFYPWTFEHYEEAIANASKVERLVLWSALLKVANDGLKNSSKNEFALSILQETVERYWYNLALQEADKHIE